MHIIIFVLTAIASVVVLKWPNAAPFLIGLPSLIFGVWKLKNLRTNWVPAIGTVSWCEVGHEDVATHFRVKKYFFPRIEFSYLFENSLYISSIYAIDKSTVWSLDQIAMKSIVSGLMTEKEIPIFINPKNPQKATVVNKVNPRTVIHAYTFIFTSLVCLFLGLYSSIK